MSMSFDLVAHLHSQRAWSKETFGPEKRTAGILEHLRKELVEVEEKPEDLEEWIDVVLLAFDGAWRQGHSPEAIAAALVAKFHKNMNRDWPDWKDCPEDAPIHHCVIIEPEDVAGPGPLNASLFRLTTSTLLVRWSSEPVKFTEDGVVKQARCEVFGCDNSQLLNHCICKSCENEHLQRLCLDWEKFIAGRWLNK